jgi:hypothetical protein
MRSALLKCADERGKTLHISRAALIVSSLMLPILPVNVVALALLQRGYNRLVSEER